MLKSGNLDDYTIDFNFLNILPPLDFPYFYNFKDVGQLLYISFSFDPLCYIFYDMVAELVDTTNYYIHIY